MERAARRCGSRGARPAREAADFEQRHARACQRSVQGDDPVVGFVEERDGVVLSAAGRGEGSSRPSRRWDTRVAPAGARPRSPVAPPGWATAEHAVAAIPKGVVPAGCRPGRRGRVGRPDRPGRAVGGRSGGPPPPGWPRGTAGVRVDRGRLRSARSGRPASPARRSFCVGCAQNSSALSSTTAWTS